MLKKMALFALGFVLTATTSLPTGSAHNGPFLWPVWNEEDNVTWVLDSTRVSPLSGSAATASFDIGNDQWDVISGSTFDYDQLADVDLANWDAAHDGGSSPICGRPKPTNADLHVFGNHSDGFGEDGSADSVLAATEVCQDWYQFWEITHAYITIDSDHGSDWYTGDGATPPNKFDLRSTVTHEFGHAAGFGGHWDGDEPMTSQSDWEVLCDDGADNDPPTHTMCAFATLGHSRKRTTEIHDEHTFAGLY